MNKQTYKELWVGSGINLKSETLMLIFKMQVLDTLTPKDEFEQPLPDKHNHALGDLV